MRKIILILLFSLCSVLYSQDYKILKDYVFYYQGETELKIQNDKIFEYNPATKEWLDTSNHYYKFSYKVNENGFVEVFCNDKIFFLLKDNITYVIDYKDGLDVLSKSHIYEIKSSGNYSETIKGNVVDYKAENLRSAIIRGGLEDPFWFYTENPPFVTKQGNSGIGEYLELKFVNPQKKLSILGGYVNTKRQDLFKKNNRLKKVLITDLNSDYSIEMDFEDIAMFQEISFEKYLSNIRIEILDVYKGSKYDDTCISGIMISNFYPLKNE